MAHHRTTASLRSFALAVLALAGGGAVGWLLFEPRVGIPPQWGAQALMPVYGFLQDLGAPRYAAIAVVLFLLDVPKTLVLGLVSAFVLRHMTAWRRLAFYAVFICPVLIHAVYWHWFLNVRLAAKKAGLSSWRFEAVFDNEIGNLAVQGFLTYTLFAAVVAIAYARMRRRAASVTAHSA